MYFFIFCSDGSELDGYVRTLDVFFRTFGRRPNGPQQKKGRLHLSPKLSNAPVCPKLSVETYPHACNNERAARVQKSKQGRPKPWHQTRKREPIFWKSLLLHLQSAKIEIAPATMSCKLAMWHIYLISTVSAVPPRDITNMQKKVLIKKKKTFRKNVIFLKDLKM